MKVLFYETEDGSCPVLDFLDTLPPKLSAKVFRDIKLLQEKGTSLREPYSKSLENGIYELRTKFSSDIVRNLYFFTVGETAIITNGFLKKSKKTPPEERKRAERYRTDYIRRNPS